MREFIVKGDMTYDHVMNYKHDLEQHLGESSNDAEVKSPNINWRKGALFIKTIIFLLFLLFVFIGYFSSSSILTIDDFFGQDNLVKAFGVLAICLIGYLAIFHLKIESRIKDKFIFVISDDGITSSNDNGSYVINWNKIYSINKLKSCIVFEIREFEEAGEIKYLFIPNLFFKDNNEIEEIYSFCNANAKRHSS